MRVREEGRKKIDWQSWVSKITPKEKEGEFKLRDYDVKDFSVIVNRYGAEWFRSPELFDGE